MHDRLPPLAALRAFESSARLGSFARAGDDLGLSAAAVSHQIKLLEHWLGLQLFERRARGVVLNDAGIDYAASVRQAFARLMNATHSTRARRMGSVITVRAQFTVATLWLAPLLLRWRELHADVELRLDALPYAAPLLRGPAEVAVYHEGTDAEGLSRQTLLQGPLRAFASPRLLRERNAPPAPAELLGWPLLHLAPGARMSRHPGFRSWFREAGVEVPAKLPGMQFNLEHLAYTACLQGAGCALLSQALCADALREGSLIALPGPALVHPHPYLIAHRPEAREPVVQLVAWLLEVADEQRRYLEQVPGR